MTNSDRVLDMIYNDTQTLRRQVAKLEVELSVIKTEKKLGVFIISTLWTLAVSFLYNLVPTLFNK